MSPRLMRLICVALPLCSCSATPERPSVILLVVDTLRADYLSCYGHSTRTTPNIDRLAADGHLFENAYSAMPTTLPSHSSLMTSLYPSELGVTRNGQFVPSQALTLAEVLKSEGYTTAAFVGSYALNHRYRLNQGFDLYSDGGDRPQRPAGEVCAQAIQWLRQRPRQFFLFLHFYDPHTPYFAPQPFRDTFRAPNHPVPAGVEFSLNPEDLSPEAQAAIVRAYEAEIAYTDHVIGEFLVELNTLGLAENTLLVLTSDHGENLTELIDRYGYGFDHGEFLYRHQIWVPLIFHLPTATRTSRTGRHREVVSLIDVMPTILDFLGVRRPGGLRGTSFRRALEGAQLEPRPAFSERRSFQKVPKEFLTGEEFSVIEGDWHLIVSQRTGDELYRYRSDLDETVNLFHDEKVLAARLSSSVSAWRKGLGLPLAATRSEKDELAKQRLKSLGYVE
jgi:arylsulfatase A-like enzyme